MTASAAPSPRLPTQARVVDRLEELECSAWNDLNKDGTPFLSYEFLSALESCNCVGGRFGWLPCHLILEDQAGELLAAMPLYIKTNSYGEFVFDHGWAQIFEKTAGAYYPKLTSAIPYTPVPGNRLLGADKDAAGLLIESAVELARGQQLSGVHWLFHSESDEFLRQDFLIHRLGCQYHWHNADYDTFDDFLGALNSKKRKMIRRERRAVREQSIECRILHGDELPEKWWPVIASLYAEIYERKWGVATFSEIFFREIGRKLPRQILFVIALLHGDPIACSICYRDRHTLYGRHWGCRADYRQLHFEVCYYAGIEYCIANKLQRFEPGAQGEHKIWRGFLPVPTWSSHWVRDDDFRGWIRTYCRHEERMMNKYMKELFEVYSPYRRNAVPTAQQSLFS